MDEKLKILIVEDSLPDAELEVCELDRAGLSVAHRLVETEEAFRRELVAFQPRVILSDLRMPHFDGMTALAIARAVCPDVPFIFVSGTIGEESAIHALKNGATDYVLKNNLVRLPVAVERAMQDARERAARREQEQKIAYLSRIRAMMSAINSTIIRVKDRQELFQDACRIAVDHGAFAMAWIGLLDPATLDVTAAAWAGEEAESLARMKATARSDLPEGGGVMGQAIREKRPVFNNNIAADDRAGGMRRRESLKRGYRSLIALPLLVDEEVVGNLSLYQGIPDFYSEDEVALLTTLAGDISFALEHLARQQKLTKLSRIRSVLGAVSSAVVRIQDRKQLLEEACRIAAEVGNFRMSWIGTLDRATLGVSPVAWSGLDDDFVRQLRVTARDDGLAGEGTTPRAARSKQTAVDNDFTANPDRGYIRRYAIERGVRSAISLPLLVDGEVKEVFSLYAEETGFFTEDEAKALEEMASDISFALQSIVRQGRIEKLSRTRAVSSGISSTIVRVRDRQELFQESCRIAIEAGQFPFAWIGVLDAATLDVTPVAWAGEHAETLTRGKSSARDDVLEGKGAVGQAIRARRTVLNNDIAGGNFGGPRRHEILRLGFQSQITLPLFEGETVIATLTMYAQESNFFDQEEMKLLEELAGDISFAVETIARRQKLEKLSRVRAVLSEVNTAIIRVRERDALLRETCRIAVEHGKFEMVWVGALDHAKQEIRPITWEGFSTDTARAVTWSSISAPGVTLSEVLRTRRPALRNDMEAGTTTGILRREAAQRGCRSTVCLPFVIDDSVVAAAMLFATGRGFFDAEEVALLNEVAGNISFALEHIEKEDRIARLSRIQAVMSSINALIVRVRDRQELFNESCRIAVEHGGFGIAWIGTLDPRTLEVTPVAHAGLRDNESLGNFKSSASIEHPLGRGVVGRAIRERIPVSVNALAKEAGRGERRKEAMRRGYQSRIALPLLVENDVVGVMVLFATERDFFNEDELKLLSELAGDISFALEHLSKEARLNYLAYYDELTGLPNRTLLGERLGRQLNVAAEKGTKVAVLLSNVNRFRFINESLGRNAGDTLLRELGARSRTAWPDPENLARIAPDSFGGIVADLKDEMEIAHLPGQLVTEVVKLPFKIGDNDLSIAMAAGIAVFPTDGSDADTLFRNAEAALKQAKASGEHYLFYRPEMNARVAETLLLENKLRQALDREEFVLHYQPKVDLAQGTISGLEALIRWNDPESGLVPPMKFIPLLEETGMILEAGRWAMRKAIADYRDWYALGLRPPRIAVNVSPIQLRQKDFVDVVRAAIAGAATDSHGLDLEITESLIMEDIDGNIGKLLAVRDMGVNIAIDDFGTGYSSLGYLAKLPVNALKIDRSFIITMANDADSMTIVSTIISLAHSLKLKVIAEGVDSEEQRKILTLLKCDQMQGYLFSRPVPAPDVRGLLAARHSRE